MAVSFGRFFLPGPTEVHPDVLQAQGTLLGEHQINIAEYHQARRSRGGDALAAVAVDEVSAAVVVRLG
jgi:hypothetical protein